MTSLCYLILSSHRSLWVLLMLFCTLENRGSSNLPAEWEEMWDGSVWPLRIWWPCSHGRGPCCLPSCPMVLPLQPAVPAFMVVSQAVFWESESRAFGTTRAWTPGLTDPHFHHRPSQTPAQLGGEERFHHSSWAGLPVFRVLCRHFLSRGAHLPSSLSLLLPAEQLGQGGASKYLDGRGSSSIPFGSPFSHSVSLLGYISWHPHWPLKSYNDNN